MSPATTLRRPPGRAPARRGFTMIELLMVMVVIGILASLLIVAVSSARQNVHIAKVRTEITALESALTDFKVRFGDYPPSRITLYETGTDWATGTEQQRSRAILRRFWDKINFAIDRDINGDGDTDDTIELRGAECLAFFLGGMHRDGTSTPIQDRNGFSKNPADPFDTSGTNREGPFFEFDPGRLQESTLADGMPVYFDPLANQQRPYLYASAYDGRGYENTDVLGTDRMTTGVYRLSAGTSAPAWKDKSFQIISPGFDGQYGEGGEWNENTADTVLDHTGARGVERDNITNFHSGVLAPN